MAGRNVTDRGDEENLRVRGVGAARCGLVGNDHRFRERWALADDKLRVRVWWGLADDGRWRGEGT
jgi:hypothetical protein